MTAPTQAPAALTQERLSPANEDIVRATLPLVGSKIDEIAPLFYRRMFAAHPELLSDTFNRGNQAQGAQQKALAASVATFATLLVTPDAPSPRALLERIGHKHASLGITEAQYQVVHEHLFAAIVEVLGAAVTPEVAGAWDEVYWIMARTLVSLEAELYRGAGVEPGDVFRTARVVERVDESSAVASFVLESATGEPLPGFQPGQYTSVGVRLPDGARQLRQYSMSDAAGDGRWRITVKRVEAGADPEGEVSSWLHANLRPGDHLQVTLPFGDLTLDTASGAPVVLVSAGIGCTPMLGMLRHLAAHDPARSVTVLHADRDRASAPLFGEMVETVARLGHASLHAWFEEGAEPGADGLDPSVPLTVSAGLMSLADVLVPAEAEVYLCGSNGFLQAVREGLHAQGVAEERVHYELFAPNDWLLPA